MAIITLPANLKVAAECTIGQVRFDVAEASDSTGNQAARLLGPPRWRLSLVSVSAMSLAEAAQWEAIQLKLRGRVNHLAAGDPVRTEPQGTLRGLPVTRDDLASGAVSMALVGGTAGTILTGDWLQIGTGLGTSQLVKVMADNSSTPAVAVAAIWKNNALADATWQTGGAQPAAWSTTGVISVTFEPPLRQAYLAGSVITWSQPVGYFKQTSEPQWTYRPGRNFKQGGFAIDLLEAFN